MGIIMSFLESDYRNAVRYVRETGRTSAVQVMYKININYKAAELMLERMEREGIVTAAAEGWKRDIFKTSEGA